MTGSQAMKRSRQIRIVSTTRCVIKPEIAPISSPVSGTRTMDRAPPIAAASSSEAAPPLGFAAARIRQDQQAIGIGLRRRARAEQSQHSGPGEVKVVNEEHHRRPLRNHGNPRASAARNRCVTLSGSAFNAAGRSRNRSRNSGTRNARSPGQCPRQWRNSVSDIALVASSSATAIASTAGRNVSLPDIATTTAWSCSLPAELERQARLADARFTFDEHASSSARSDRAKRFRDPFVLSIAPYKRQRRHRPPRQRLLRADRIGPERGSCRSTAAWTSRTPSLGSQSQFVAQQHSQLFIDRQRVDLAAGAIQRNHLLLA